MRKRGKHIKEVTVHSAKIEKKKAIMTRNEGEIEGKSVMRTSNEIMHYVLTHHSLEHSTYHLIPSKCPFNKTCN